MYEIDYAKPCHIHMIGIGGISMSGLAHILIDRGFKISGSDAIPSDLTRELENDGVIVSYPQSAANITDDIDCVVYTAAIHKDNPEYEECIKRNLPMLTRAQLIGEIMKHYNHAIAVSGTHGKTTTTGMIASILLAAGEDPTVSIGGILPTIGSNIRIGRSDLFVTEACEYTNSFLEFKPTLDVILNIEADHLDFFKDIDDIRKSFKQFVKILPSDGIVVINKEIERYEEIIEGFEGEVITVGFEGAHIGACDITYDDMACPTFTYTVDGIKKDRVRLRVPGEHNVHNSLAAIAIALRLGIDPATFEKGLSEFTGTERRFEYKGVIDGTTIIDDYAHHPQEIEATLKAAMHYPHKKIRCAFQPHTYTRTKALMKEFAKALSLADEVVMVKIYPARESDTLGVSSGDIADLINKSGKSHAIYLETFEEIYNYLKEHNKPGDLCITMGAGDVYKIGEMLLKK